MSYVLFPFVSHFDPLKVRFLACIPRFSYQATLWFNARWGSGRYAPFVLAELLSILAFLSALLFPSHILQGG